MTELKEPTPSLRDTPPLEGNCLKMLSLFDFLFPSWELIVTHIYPVWIPKEDLLTDQIDKKE